MYVSSRNKLEAHIGTRMEEKWKNNTQCTLFRVYRYNLQSLSDILTVVWPWSPTIMLLGSEDRSMDRVKLSSPSTILSSLIVALNVPRVLPVRKRTSYGPAL